jgi:hypothetical protein
MAYNDQNDNYKPTPFSVTRDSIATRVNKQGLIEVVGQDKLRIDYTDSSNGVALLEPSRTNLVPYSENFNSGWSQYGSPTINISSIISPDGTLNGSNITRGSNATPLRYQSLTSTGTQYTFSLYAKKGSVDKIYLDIGDVANVEFTLTDEWQRFEITQTPTNFTHIDISFGTSTSGDNFYIYGAQLEAGSYATSYIPTSGSTATRSADDAENTSTQVLTLSNQASFYWYVKGQIGASDLNNTSYIMRYNLDSSETGFSYVALNTNPTEWRIRIQSSTTSNFHSTTVSKLEDAKIVVTVNTSTFSIYANGALILSQAYNGDAITFENIRIQFDMNNENRGTVNIVDTKAYNTELTQAEAIALTTI